MSAETLDLAIVCGDMVESQSLRQTIEEIQLSAEKYTITTLTGEDESCKDYDAVLAILGKNDSVHHFADLVSKMKLVCYVPTVISIIPRERYSDVTRLLDFLPADITLQSPVASEVLGEALRTIMAVHDIESVRSERFRRRKPLGAILVENSVITSYQLSLALEYSEKEDVKLGKALVELGIVPEEKMILFLAAQIGVEHATTQHYTSVDIDASRLITESFAEHNLCIPFKRDGTDLHVILTDPKDLQLLDRLRDMTECTIVPYLGRNVDILKAINRVYKTISTDAETSELFEKNQSEYELPIGTGSDFNDDSDEGIVRLVKLILANASKDRASDVHIEPRDNELVIRYRIDGELRRVMNPPMNSARPLIARLKILANLDIAERRLPQDGRFVIGIDEKTSVDARLSILPTVFGEKAVIRLLDSSGYANNLSALGFSAGELAILREQIHKPYGLIVITGPTGSGKTTSLYAALQELTGDERNVVSVEDPVEYRMPEVSQVQVNRSTGLTFAAALRSILRQDPDVVMIGEIRDAETADIAVKMALTGHLVFATLHTNDAPSAITRFVNIGIPPLLLSSCLNLVIAQRLVKRICPECKTEIDTPAHFAEKMGTDHAPEKVYKGEGCVSCHSSGYSGRVGIYEMLKITPEIREMILQEKTEQEIRVEGEKNGMKRLFDAGVVHVENGTTTLEQILTFLE